MLPSVCQMELFYVYGKHALPESQKLHKIWSVTTQTSYCLDLSNVHSTQNMQWETVPTNLRSTSYILVVLSLEPPSNYLWMPQSPYAY